MTLVAGAAGGQVIPGLPPQMLALPRPDSAISKAWVSYLEWKEGQPDRNAQVASPLWAPAEQVRWPQYDLAGQAVPDHAMREVLSLGARGNVYRIVTRFTATDRSSSHACADKSVDVTTYATKVNGQWLLSNAILQNTDTWFHANVGVITFYVDPALKYDVVRARHAAAFVDTVATLLKVPKPRDIVYYVTSTMDVACEIQGVTRSVKLGPVGGFASAQNRMVFSGNPTLGEAYLHELAHVVVAPLLGANSTVLALEGIATWLGGSGTRDFIAVEHDLGDYLRAHPKASLDSIFDANQAEVIPAGGVLSAMIFERAGSSGLKRFLQAGSFAEVRTVLASVMGQPWQAIAADWRERVLAASPNGTR